MMCVETAEDCEYRVVEIVVNGKKEVGELEGFGKRHRRWSSGDG